MENHDAEQAIMERFNSGAEAPAADPAMVESLWGAVSSIPPEQRGTTAVGLGAVAGGLGAVTGEKLASLDPEQHVGLMIRVMLLNALSERGVLNDYLANESIKRKLFVAVASVPFDKNDLAEALSQRMLRDAPPDIAQKTRTEMIEAGLDPDFPKIAKRLIGYLRDNE